MDLKLISLQNRHQFNSDQTTSTTNDVLTLIGKSWKTHPKERILNTKYLMNSFLVEFARKAWHRKIYHYDKSG